MALSLRLPSDIEQMIVAYSASEGVSKSSVIVQSIRDFFERQKPKPTAYEIYLEVMAESKARQAKNPQEDWYLIDKETRPHKIAMHKAIQAKHARRQAAAQP
jgi:predicted transcriptional regulator